MTMIFSVIVSSLLVSSLLRSQLFLVLAAIRDLMTTANLTLSCFMVIALKQQMGFCILYFLDVVKSHFITFSHFVEALQWSNFK